MSDMAISNRLHRSGAIDFNCEYNIRQAQLQLSSNNKHGKRLWSKGLGPKDDALSVCEGEPVFTVKRSKTNQCSSLDSGRNPIALLSSLNGYAPPGCCDIANTKFDAQIDACADASAANDVKTELKAYDKLRNIFFSDSNYTGISVSKWAFSKLGHQANQFVATAVKLLFSWTTIHRVVCGWAQHDLR